MTKASVTESPESEIDMTAVLTELAPPSTNRRSRPPNLAPNLARAIVVVVFSAFVVISFLRILYEGFGPPSRIVKSIVYLAPLLWLQLHVFGRTQAQYKRLVLYAAFLVQAVLVTLAVQFSPVFLSLSGFLAGSALLVLPPRLAWPPSPSPSQAWVGNTQP